MFTILTRWVPITLCLLIFAGCSSSPTKEGEQEGAEVTEQSTGASGTYEGTEGAGATTSAASEAGSWSGDPLDDPYSLLATRILYFDFDQSSIGMDNREIIRAHAEYLASNPHVSVRLEGHADERGTREYNLGLGERRANAVRSLLMAEGVADNQIIVISYGEERPVSMMNNEESWALNRRVELVY
ncbi:peptidoglycan-associated lipoprotein Pal [bacterium endosymbiont of Escarpia laminata]|nr:MAG: peptidoglycan-associated lipoprotein Pal [bacterium endosymbiont of Escarpia laminata]